MKWSHTPTITPSELAKGENAFAKNESRDSMYQVATFLLTTWWGDHAKMVDALTVVLLTWNSAFYRYGDFDQDSLEDFLRCNWTEIESCKARDIASLQKADHGLVVEMFKDALRALQIKAGSSKGRRSPVAVAKTIHLLAPRFFPLWDDKIAKAYGCHYSHMPADCYARFCYLTKRIAVGLARQLHPSHKSLLKRIDEYNYAKYTKQWI